MKIAWGIAVPDSADFRTVFCARIRALRVAQGMTQAEMAKALGIGGEAYRTYENRALMPHHLVEPFARITGVEIEGLFRAEDEA
jgi:transcriptional regulator with XRE-family HTH domain